MKKWQKVKAVGAVLGGEVVLPAVLVVQLVHLQYVGVFTCVDISSGGNLYQTQKG